MTEHVSGVTFEDLGHFMDQVNADAMVLDASIIAGGASLNPGARNIWNMWTQFLLGEVSYGKEDLHPSGWVQFYLENRHLMPRFVSTATLWNATAEYAFDLRRYWDQYVADGGKTTGKRPELSWTPPPGYYEHKEATDYIKWGLVVAGIWGLAKLLSYVKTPKG